tara:strand:+ start:6474 stop:7802 length:1329 start_codon:yes stop_codon:yes gene_type:complete
MRIFFIFLIFTFFQHCSFDNKSGIWKSETKVLNNEASDDLSQFEDLNTDKSSFKKELSIKNNFNFNLPKVYSNSVWPDIFYNQSNNFKNFKYSDLNRKLFQSKKITKNKIDNYILFENNNIISTDQAGNINIYSLKDNKKIFQFNFYKKKFKKNKKKLNIIIENNVIYASDNLGYLYSLDLINKKILWAKNFKIPFRSNLKIFKNKLILSNQNNHLYYVNKRNGNILKLIPTEETTVKNKFENNISIYKDSTFFLNTFGSLYSIDNEKMQINWFINLNQTSTLTPSNLFLGNKLIANKNKIIVTTNNFTYIMDSNTGSILYKKNFSSLIKPLLIDNYLFLISKNDLFISLNLNNGEIIYSYDINKKISEFLNTKRKKAKFKNIFMLNNKIYIFLENSYVVIFEVIGNIEKIIKLPYKLNSQPIVIEDSIIFFNFKNKISIVN